MLVLDSPSNARGYRHILPSGNPTAELREWLRQNALAVPSDLIELWELTGGGDIFDSETLLRPTVTSIPNGFFVHDDIEGRNSAHAETGKPSEHLIYSSKELFSPPFACLTRNS